MPKNGQVIGANLSWSVTNHMIRYTQPGVAAGFGSLRSLAWTWVWLYFPGSPRYWACASI